MFNPGRRTTLDLLNRAQTEAYRASEAADRFEREGQRRIESDEANHHDFDLPLTPAADHPGAPPAQESRASGTRLRWLPLSVLLAGIALAVLSVVGALHFVGGSSQAVRVATANAHASSTAPDAAASVPTAPTTGSIRLKPDPTEGKANGGPGVGEADRDRDPAVGTPDAAGSPGGTEADQARQLAALKKQAADQLRRGNREQALAAASGALAVSRDDQDMKTLVDGLLNEAIGRAATADKMAVDAGATAYADGLYAQAREDEAEARRLSGERRSVAAVRAYWKAADSFNEAAAGGREKRGATDVAGIKQALETYRSAYENLDLEAIKRYRAPDAEQLAALEAALHVARAYQVEISSPSIAIDADAASASCEVVYRLTTKSEETPYLERQSTVFRLQRRGSAWVIVGVDVRAPR